MPNMEILIDCYKKILTQIDDPEREGLVDTPLRAAKAILELVTPTDFNFTTFDAAGYDQMIVDRDLEFFSLCEHHMIPFFGTCTIGYIPDKRIVGLSKLGRTLEYFSHRLNTQEYMAQNIADYLQENLKPKGLGVIIKARHLCKEMRGLKKRGEMITSCLKGCFLTNDACREEFMKL